MKRIGLLIAALAFVANDAMACAVCFGDPNSPLTHGARVAVWFMVGVIAFVLSGIIAVAIFWYRRSRLLDVQATLQPPEQTQA